MHYEFNLVSTGGMRATGSGPVIEKATGDFLGWFHFRPGKDAAPGEVELGYRLRKSAWGRGMPLRGRGR
jgi:RimJ/RimL family protein N-acetyltransferase